MGRIVFPPEKTLVLHRFKKRFWMASTLAKVPVEGAVYEPLLRFQIGMDVHDGSGLTFFLIDILFTQVLKRLQLKLTVLVLDQKLNLAFHFSELLVTKFY